jgi:exopolysaccharide biosynthesis polyprenyl glycosylphosphotransferase
MGTKIQDSLRRIMLRALMVIDIGLLMLAFGLAAVVTNGLDERTLITSFFATRVSLVNCALFAILLFLGHSILVVCNLYQSKRMSTRNAEALDVLRAMTFLAVCFWCGGKLFRVSETPNYFLLAFGGIAALLIIVMRLLIRSVLGFIRKRGRNLRHVLILGTNPRAVDFARIIAAMPERGFNLMGFVDDDWTGMQKFRESGFLLACSYDELPEFLRKNIVDEIAIYLPMRSFHERSTEIAQLAKHHGILVRLDADILDRKFLYHPAEVTGRVPQIIASGNDMDGSQLLMKRAFDFVGSLVLLILLCPLFLIVSLLIKLTSPGKVFFTQKRVGLNKRQFTMYKFRTMVPEAESIQADLSHLNEMTGPVFKIRNDPRITSLGRILRKTSIDELPQLFNVLRGDMSLVGPRAIPVRDFQFFSEDWHRRRFSVPPGITCLWQVYGRNTIPFEEWMILDMQYIDSWSLWLDIKILVLTIPAVLRGSGAA